MRVESTARTTLRAIGPLVCSLLGVLIQGAVALAQGTPPDRAQASLHFDRGLEFIEENAYDAAVVEFERAYELSPNDAALYNLGMAYVAAGRPVEAVAALSRYLESARQPLPKDEVLLIQQELERQRSRIGALVMTVEPPAAHIKIDGRDVGTTSLSAPIALATGTHTIEVAHAGYETAVRKFAIAGEGQVELHVELRSVQAGLAAQLPIRCAVPDVAVLIDDRVVAQPVTAAPVLTSTGAHVVRFRRPGYLETARSVVLAPGMAAPIECGLHMKPSLPDKLAAKLSVRVGVPKSKARLNGEPLPPDGRVPLGRHRLAVMAPGFEPWMQEIVLAAGEHRIVDVELQRMHAAYAADAGGSHVQRDIAFVLGGVGIVAGIAALSTFLIADDRYGGWEDEKLALDALADDVARAPPEPELEMELARRTKENNERLKSVWQLDTLAAGLAIGGGALLATGTVLLLTAGGDEPTSTWSARLMARGPSLHWVARF